MTAGQSFLLLLTSLLVKRTSGNFPFDLNQLDRGIGVQEQPNTLIVLKKTPLTVNCTVVAEVGFEPTKFRWEKDGRPIHGGPRSRVRVFKNGTLHIREIKQSDKRKDRRDEGFYECFVENNIGTIIARRVAVKVARISKTFSQEPISQTARAGSTVVFQCSIDAVTGAHYAWEKNRNPIDDNLAKYILHQSGKLQINDVQPSDSGSYKCIAANKALFGIGIDGASIPFKWRNGREVTLDVAEERRSTPYLKVLVAPPNVTEVRLGEMAELECIVDGYPKPIITWTKDGKPVSFKGVEIQEGGSLKFRKLITNHTGQYKCHAKRPGSDEALELPANLTVIVEPVMEKGPESSVHPVAKLMILDCKVSGQPAPVVSWFKDGRKVLRDGRFNMQLKEGSHQLSVYGVEDADSGYYQCVAQNEAGWTSSIARIKIELMKDAPNAPQDVKVKVTSATEAEVKWKMKQKQNEAFKIISFTVHYREDKWSAEEKLRLSKTSDLVLYKLKPQTNYTVYVKAYNGAGASANSEPCHFTTMESAPLDFPKPTLESKSSTTMLVEWSPLPEEVLGGSVTKYTIFYGRTDSKVVKNITVDGNTYKQFIVGLTPDTEYRVRMLAATKGGYPEFTDSEWPWMTYRTLRHSSGDSVTPVVTIVDLNTTTVKVSWRYQQEVSLTKQVIFFRNLQQQDTMVMYTLNADAREIIFQGLMPESMYELYILGEDGLQQKGLVTKIFSTQSNRTLRGDHVPSHVTGKALLPNAVNLKWSYIGDDSRAVTHYVVRYRPLEADLCIPEKTVTTHSQEAVLTDLEPYTLYNISVSAAYDDGQSEFSKPLFIRTKEDVPSPPENVEAVIVSPGKVRLQWTPPHRPNGFIRGHVISYNIEVVKTHVWTEVYQEGQKTAALVQNLTAKTYIFRVQACNGAGKSQPSSKLTVHMGSFTTHAVRSGLTDQQLGILGGAAIGLTSIFITIIVVYCRHRHYSRRYAQSVRNEMTGGSGAVNTSGPCVCQRGPEAPRQEVVVPMETRQQAAPVDSIKLVDARMLELVGDRVYQDGGNTKAEELLALLSSREGACSSSGDSQSASTEGTKEDLSDDTATTSDDVTVQLTNDTAC